LSEAKNSGKNKYIIFNYLLKNTFNERFNKITGLKAALKNNDFVVHYQPKAYTATNEIYELEALIRWNHPSLGLIYPNDFITLAEEIGIIKEIDTLVLIKACEQIKHWVNVCKSPYSITVNISPLFFMDHDFINKIDTIISEVGIDSSYLGIEITETVAINDTEKAINTINELKNRKIKVYLDDFGKGYSSLNYLKHLPIDYLNIDKSFIDGINVNRIDEEIISNIIYICSLLGIKVISEGIETLEQLDFIKAKSCFGYQGYLLSKPMLIEDLNI
jgi:EAL domain-containing protein (putative c-di-GMP-specific phosphodiesterase class I)